MKIFKWFRDCFLGIRYGILARTINMSINDSRPLSTVTVFDDAFTLSMPAIPDILHNTGDVFILTSLLTHCVLTKDVYLQTIIRMPAWIFLAIICSNNLRIRDDRCAVLQEIFRLLLILYYGLRLNFSLNFPRLSQLSKQLKMERKRLEASSSEDEKEKEEHGLSEDDVQRFYKGVPTLVKRNERVAYHAWPYDKTLEIPHSQFTAYEGHQSLKGHNGHTFKGMLHYNNKKIKACIKTNILGDLRSLRGLMKELKLLKFVGHHDNLQTIFGAYTKEITDGKLYVILENCGNRTLSMALEDLQKTEVDPKDPSSAKFVRENLLIDFYRWAYEISSGMKFISSKGIVHGLLTCDCILVNEEGTIKLTDYGTAPFLSDTSMFTPDKWSCNSWKYLAPEAIVKQKFGVEQDIWSFAVVVWRMFTIGADPYPTFDKYSKIFSLTLLDGMRPEADTRIPQFIYDLLTKCWFAAPENRPNFDMCCQYTYLKTKPKRRIVACDGDFIT